MNGQEAREEFDKKQREIEELDSEGQDEFEYENLDE